MVITRPYQCDDASFCSIRGEVAKVKTIKGEDNLIVLLMTS